MNVFSPSALTSLPPQTRRGRVRDRRLESGKQSHTRDSGEEQTLSVGSDPSYLTPVPQFPHMQNGLITAPTPRVVWRVSTQQRQPCFYSGILNHPPLF